MPTRQLIKAHLKRFLEEDIMVSEYVISKKYGILPTSARIDIYIPVFWEEIEKYTPDLSTIHCTFFYAPNYELFWKSSWSNIAFLCDDTSRELFIAHITINYVRACLDEILTSHEMSKVIGLLETSNMENINLALTIIKGIYDEKNI